MQLECAKLFMKKFIFINIIKNVYDHDDTGHFNNLLKSVSLCVVQQVLIG